MGSKMDPKVDRVELDEKAKRLQGLKKVVLLNKPLGIVSCQPEKNYTPAVQLLGWDNFDTNDEFKPSGRFTSPMYYKKMAVCGRLDVNSTGLLIFSQNGILANQILSQNVEKEYLVRVDQDLVQKENIAKQALSLLRKGITCTGEKLKAQSVEIVNENQLKFVLTQGKHHHIRRMCQSVGLKVVALKRVRIGNITLGNLPSGKWKFMS